MSEGTQNQFEELDNTNCVSGRISGGPKSNSNNYKYLGTFDSYEDCSKSSKIPAEAKAITYHKYIKDWEWSNQCYSINDNNTKDPNKNYATCGIRINNTVKDLLEKKCPLSISQTRDGNVYINQTNSALRDKYLFSGCTDSNTCNTTNMDPISKNILDSIPSKGHCGAWDLGDYGWNQDKGKWVNKIDYNYIKNEINNQKSIINETSDQIEKKAEALEEKQKQVYGQTKEIEDKMRLLETRDKMRELSIDRNLYKNKVIYSLFSVVLAFVIIMIGLYAFFNKKLNLGE